MCGCQCVCGWDNICRLLSQDDGRQNQARQLFAWGGKGEGSRQSSTVGSIARWLVSTIINQEHLHSQGVKMKCHNKTICKSLSPPSFGTQHPPPATHCHIRGKSVQPTLATISFCQRPWQTDYANASIIPTQKAPATEVRPGQARPFDRVLPGQIRDSRDTKQTLVLHSEKCGTQTQLKFVSQRKLIACETIKVGSKNLPPFPSFVTIIG